MKWQWYLSGPWGFSFTIVSDGVSSLVFESTDLGISPIPWIWERPCPLDWVVCWLGCLLIRLSTLFPYKRRVRGRVQWTFQGPTAWLHLRSGQRTTPRTGGTCTDQISKLASSGEWWQESVCLSTFVFCKIFLYEADVVPRLCLNSSLWKKCFTHKVFGLFLFKTSLLCFTYHQFDPSQSLRH